MECCGKNNKGKNFPNNTRGLSDRHLHPHSSTPHVSVSTPASAPTSPPVAVAAPYEAPQHAANNGPQEVNFFAGGNENYDGEQEIDEVEVGTSSNGVVSQIFGNNGGKFDFKIGNNVNSGGNQKINKVKLFNRVTRT